MLRSTLCAMPVCLALGFAFADHDSASRTLRPLSTITEHNASCSFADSTAKIARA